MQMPGHVYPDICLAPGGERPKLLTGLDAPEYGPSVRAHLTSAASDHGRHQKTTMMCVTQRKFVTTSESDFLNFGDDNRKIE